VDRTVSFSSIDQNNIYDVGSLYASALMNARNLADTALNIDRIVLQSMYYHVPNMSVGDAAKGVLDADTALFQGRYSPQLLAGFCRRDILTDTSICQFADRPRAASPHTPALTVYPNPATEHLRIRSEAAIRRVRIRSLSGALVADIPIEGRQKSTLVPLQGLSRGMYMVEILGAGYHQFRRIALH
jgi:hypothetical protein